MALSVEELAQALADMAERMDLTALTQSIADLSEEAGGNTGKVIAALEAIAQRIPQGGASGPGAADVIAAIEALRTELRERAESTELVLLPVYRKDGVLESARIRRVPIKR